jgi:heptosyltransferase-2
MVVMKPNILTDCVHFPLDRPCQFHKKTGVVCRCNHYQSLPAVKFTESTTKILIIKLDAMGDVLRTTFVLPGLKEKYGAISLTWAVAPISVDVLAGNPLIDRIWPFGKDVFGRIASEKFDVIINLDLSPLSLTLATLANADCKIGYWLDGKRKVQCSNKFAYQWLQMSAFDGPKKANKNTYQWWMAHILGLKYSDYPIFVPITRYAKAKALTFSRKHGLKKGKVVGINPGAGGRWELKRWTLSGYIFIINALHKAGYKVLLLGGPDEADLIKQLMSRCKGKALSSGTDNTLPEFFAKLNLCDVVICGDTMALHAALGLKKKVLALVGPTSAAELEMYGQGLKVVPDMPCVCCYKPSCDKKPTCMEMLNPQLVWAALNEIL